MSVVAAPAVAPVVPDAVIAAGAPAVTPAAAPVVAAATPAVAPPAEIKPAVEAKPVVEAKAEKGLLSIDETPADDKKIEAKKDEAAEIKIDIPEGATIDEELLAKFKDIAKTKGLSSEAASALVAFDLERRAEEAKAGEKLIADQNAKWVQEIKADKDIGGANFDANLLASKGFLRRTPEGVAFAAAIAQDHLDSYPPLFKFIASLAKANKEDSSGVGGGGGRAPAAPSQEEILRQTYPTMFTPEGARK